MARASGPIGLWPRPDFCSWQAGRERINTRFRACWLLLARLCSHLKTRNDGDFSFRTSVWIARRKETFGSENESRGLSVCRKTSILSKTAGARDERNSSTA